MLRVVCLSSFFFFNDTATTEIYTLSLHDALPICDRGHAGRRRRGPARSRRAGRGRRADDLRLDPRRPGAGAQPRAARGGRSEEHTSELQSRQYIVCRLLLEKKKKNRQYSRSLEAI